jgi:hypothetical protein
VWNGTDAELDQLIAALHVDTGCVDCAADPSQCCADSELVPGTNGGKVWATFQASCVGHVVLASQLQLDNLLALRRTHAQRDKKAFQNGVGAWWSANVDPETLITP